jgi:predicted thioredoxin/glutaredoxin
MRVEVLVTHTCHHIPILKREINKMGIPYSVRYIEDDPELQQKFKLMGSPNILMDDELVFRGMPSIPDLEAYFKKRLS